MELVDICRECGIPPGVVNLLSGDPPSIASQLIQSDIVKKISITGSSRVGKLILKQAADKVQRVTMEFQVILLLLYLMMQILKKQQIWL